MRKPKVVVTNRIFPETRALLAAHTALDVNEAVEPWPYREVRERCREAEGMLAFMTDRVDAGFLAACPDLKVIGAALKGYDNIDADAATQAGVWVTIVPDLLTVPTAELAIGLILSLGRHIVAADARIRSRGFAGWRPELYGAGIADATVGIAGLGHVGRAIATRLVPFGCRLLGYDLTANALPVPLATQVERVDFDALLARSDYLVLALPLTPVTQLLMDEATIARMKPGARLINPARGSLVDEAAVAGALESGRLAGYAADVFECEDWAREDRPSGIEPRLSAQGAHTVLTPHIGSAVADVRREIELSAARNILAVLSGRIPPDAVNAPTERSADAQSRARQNVSRGPR
ncbi:MAG: phosphonate dehydrogenase [Alphaproteobacteria bacterium]